jgi:hypothetical protein
MTYLTHCAETKARGAAQAAPHTSQ